jgi:hypothetical protein
MSYTTTASNALRMINEKGRSITVSVPSGQSYDPATDTFTAGTPSTTVVKGVFTEFALHDVDGEKVLRTDKRILIAASALGSAPDTGASITDGSTVYKVVHTEVIQPGDTAILYMVQVRR